MKQTAAILGTSLGKEVGVKYLPHPPAGPRSGRAGTTPRGAAQVRDRALGNPCISPTRRKAQAYETPSGKSSQCVAAGALSGLFGCYFGA